MKKDMERLTENPAQAPLPISNIFVRAMISNIRGFVQALFKT